MIFLPLCMVTGMSALQPRIPTDRSVSMLWVTVLLIYLPIVSYFRYRYNITFLKKFSVKRQIDKKTAFLPSICEDTETPRLHHIGYSDPLDFCLQLIVAYYISTFRELIVFVQSFQLPSLETAALSGNCTFEMHHCDPQI